MANKKTKAPDNRTVNILIISITVLIIAILALIGFSISKSNEPALDSKFSMAETIEKLKIKENPVATLTMENGGVVEMELYPDIAPNTVCNFIELANSGFYDGLIFHRCIENFMIQGGDPEGTGMGGPEYSIAGEFTNNGFENNLSHTTGILSMARSQDNDSAGSQFFITVADSTFLDGEYASFGKVISGMETVNGIVAKETDANDKPLEDQIIKSIRVDTKGVEYPKADKLK